MAMTKKIFLTITLAACLMPTNRLTAENKLPNREERIYSLSLIWKEMLYNFAFPEELQQVNIDSLYMAYIPKMEQVKSEYEYYRILCSFMAHFNDAHTRILVNPRPDDTPPLTATNFGEKIIINGIAKQFANKIPLKSEILKINHIPVITYLTDSIYPYITASTPQWKLDKAVTEMFYGEPQSTVTLTIKTPTGKEKDVEMIRKYNSSATKVPMLKDKQVLPINIRIIDNNIGYIQLTSFLNQYLDTINTTFNNWLPELRKCKGLIIDIRGNRGGTDEAWNNLAFHLIQESQFQEKGKWFSRINNACYKNWGQNNPQLKDFYLGTAMVEIQQPPYTNELNDSLKLNQPLIIISGQMVASASESFLETMKGNRQMLVVGEPSVGALSEPTLFLLPGDLEAMICVKKYVTPEGLQPNETGILPDIEVKRDYNAYLQGKDNILDKAIEELQKEI